MNRLAEAGKAAFIAWEDADGDDTAELVYENMAVAVLRSLGLVYHGDEFGVRALDGDGRPRRSGWYTREQADSIAAAWTEFLTDVQVRRRTAVTSQAVAL